MTDFKETSCKLCLKIVTEKGFQLIDRTTTDSLDGLSVKLEFCDHTKDVICNTCRGKLNAVLEFKAMCLNTDKTIMSHVECGKTLQFDLGEVYVKEHGSGHLTGTSHHHKICRLCMQLVKGEFRGIGEEELEAIHKLLPEVNTGIIKDPVVCNPCFDSLCLHNAFLQDCLEVKKENKDIFGSPTTEIQTGTSPFDLLIKTENLDEELEINYEKTSMKTEWVYVKSEHDDQRSDMLLLRSNKTFENSDCRDTEKDGLKHVDSISVDDCDMKTTEDSLTFHQFESDSPNCSTVHCVKQENVAELYTCEICEYVPKKKTVLKRHRLRFKDRSKVQPYRCRHCDFKTKYKNSLACQVLQHKDPSQVRMYRCNECEFKTKCKNSLARHVLQHKDPSQVRMYRCNECDFQTMYKNSLGYHVLQHKDPSPSSQAHMYKCDLCDYASKYKGNINKHNQLMHTESLRVKIYSCNECDFKTRYKNSLVGHASQHEKSLQVQMYRCNDCDYQTKYRNNLADHILQHKDSSQEQMYKCDVCDYGSRHKHYFTKHQLKHKNPSEVQMYKCKDCDYSTKFRRGLKCHEMKHIRYKCGTCNFETKFKIDIKYHELNHKKQ